MPIINLPSEIIEALGSDIVNLSNHYQEIIIPEYPSQQVEINSIESEVQI